MPTILLLAHQDFQTFLRPWIGKKKRGKKGSQAQLVHTPYVNVTKHEGMCVISQSCK